MISNKDVIYISYIVRYEQESQTNGLSHILEQGGYTIHIPYNCSTLHITANVIQIRKTFPR